MLIPAPNDPASSPGAPRPGAASARPAPPGADAIDPLDLLIVLGRYRRSLVIWPLVVAVMTAVVSMLLPQTFTGVTRILPPQQQSQGAAAAMLSQLGGLASAAAPALGIKNPSDLYLGMLRSDAVADPIIERFDLKKVYGADYLADARKILALRSHIDVEKSGLIVIEVEAGDPKVAADLANAYVEQLHRLTGTLAVTEAAQRRVFFERLLLQAKEKLAEAEGALRRGMEAGGLVSVDAQSRTAVETVARLRGLISAKEVQLGAMRAYATGSHPDVRRAEQELASLRQELVRLESGSGAGPGAEKAAGSQGGPPASGMETLRLVREMKYQEVMFEQLTKQFELARLDESRDAPLIQVVDKAVAPEKRTRPKRTSMVLAAAAVALMAAVLSAFARDAYAEAARDPTRLAKLEGLRTAWRWPGRRGQSSRGGRDR